MLRQDAPVCEEGVVDLQQRGVLGQHLGDGPARLVEPPPALGQSCGVSQSFAPDPGRCCSLPHSAQRGKPAATGVSEQASSASEAGEGSRVQDDGTSVEACLHVRQQQGSHSVCEQCMY